MLSSCLSPPPPQSFSIVNSVAALDGGGIGFRVSRVYDPVRDWPGSGSSSAYASQTRVLAGLRVAAGQRPRGWFSSFLACSALYATSRKRWKSSGDREKAGP